MGHGEVFTDKLSFDKRLNSSSLFTLTPLNGLDIILTFIVYLGNPVKFIS